MSGPVNPNPSLPNRHSIYLAASGAGKSQMLNQNPDIPLIGARMIMWDQAGDHAGIHYYRKPGFLRALAAGLRADKGFRIGYAGEVSPEEFQWFMSVVWGCLDGNRLTFVKAEELSAVSVHAGKALPVVARALNEGRKYGMVFHGTSQFPQDISKTFVRACPTKFIGQQLGEEQQKRWAREIGLPVEDITALQPLQFYRHDGSANRAQLINLKYRKTSGVIFKDEPLTDLQ